MPPCDATILSDVLFFFSFSFSFFFFFFFSFIFFFFFFFSFFSSFDLVVVALGKVNVETKKLGHERRRRFVGREDLVDVFLSVGGRVDDGAQKTDAEEARGADLVCFVGAGFVGGREGG